MVRQSRNERVNIGKLVRALVRLTEVRNQDKSMFFFYVHLFIDAKEKLPGA